MISAQLKIQTSRRRCCLLSLSTGWRLQILSITETSLNLRRLFRRLRRSLRVLRKSSKPSSFWKRVRHFFGLRKSSKKKISGKKGDKKNPMELWIPLSWGSHLLSTDYSQSPIILYWTRPSAWTITLILLSGLVS